PSALDRPPFGRSPTSRALTWATSELLTRSERPARRFADDRYPPEEGREHHHQRRHYPDRRRDPRRQVASSDRMPGRYAGPQQGGPRRRAGTGASGTFRSDSTVFGR